MFDDEKTELNHKTRLAEVMARKIAAGRLSREELEKTNPPGEVWSRAELLRDFEILFDGLHPIYVVLRRSDGSRGIVMSQERPEFYFGWRRTAGP